MKNLKILFAIALSILTLHTVHAATIEKIEAEHEKSLKISLSDDVYLVDGVEGEFKVLKDVNITYAAKDFNDANKVSLTLASELSAETDYSLLSIFGAEGNIDFKTTASLEDSEIMNPETPATQGITKVVVKDSRTLELFFKNPLNEDEFEFKLLSEITTSEVQVADSATLMVALNSKLDTNSDYMFMVLSLDDVVLDEDLYNFETTGTIQSAPVDDTIPKIEIATADTVEDLSLNAAGAPEDVVPDTGAETWVIVFLTLMVQGFIVMRRKVKA